MLVACIQLSRQRLLKFEPFFRRRKVSILVERLMPFTVGDFMRKRKAKSRLVRFAHLPIDVNRTSVSRQKPIDSQLTLQSFHLYDIEPQPHIGDLLYVDRHVAFRPVLAKKRVGLLAHGLVADVWHRWRLSLHVLGPLDDGQEFFQIFRRYPFAAKRAEQNRELARHIFV